MKEDFMKNLAAIFIIIGLIVPSMPSTADQDNLATFCSDLIDEKIDNCIRKALLIDSSSEKIRTCASQSIRQASFFKHNKEALIEQLIKQGIGKSRSKAEYFLIEAYFNSLPTRLAAE
jgi:hypothetical protein